MKLLSSLVRRGKGLAMCASPNFISAAHDEVERLVEGFYMDGLLSIKYLDKRQLQVAT
jgi:hypothetical protein